MAEAAEGTLLDGAATEPLAEGIGSEPTEGLGDSQAAEGSAEEPVLYAVKVGGREEQVTFDDLTAGYMRQSDYTRKTQEVAAEKQRLAQIAQLADALEKDPQGTWYRLASVFGIQNPGQQAPQPVEELSEFEMLRREVQGYAQQQQALLNAQNERQRQEAEQAQGMQRLQSELADLHAEVGDFDDNELVQFAITRGLTYPGQLASAFQARQYESLQAQQLAERNAATEAKRRGQVVSGGHNAPAGATIPGAGGKRMSVREAWRAALQQSP